MVQAARQFAAGACSDGGDRLGSDHERRRPPHHRRAESTTARCKFLVSEPIHAGGVRRFASPDEARGSPLPEAIFAIPEADVSEVIVSGNSSRRERSPAPWPVVGKPSARRSVPARGGHQAVVAKPAASGSATADDALYERVADLFESQVNPMVARTAGGWS